MQQGPPPLQRKTDVSDCMLGYPRSAQAVWPQARTIGHPAESHAQATVTQQLLDGALSNLSTRAYKKNVERFQQAVEPAFGYQYRLHSGLSFI